MCARPRSLAISSLLFLTLPFLTATSQAEELAHSAGQNVAKMQFIAFPGMPTCAMGSVQNGDPAKGASFILAKMKSGCIFPWHWHTPNEHLMLVSGAAKVEMKDAKPLKLKAGGFALMPSKHQHQFTCVRNCLLYVYSDTVFDMHYVNADGQELTPDEALTKVGETAVAMPK